MSSAILKHNIATIADPVNTVRSLVVNGESKKAEPILARAEEITLKRALRILEYMISV